MSTPKIQSLKFENLSFRHDGGEVLLNEVSFEFPVRKVVKVESRAGGGKSTLLKILAGLTEPTSGDYLINDQKINEMSFEEFLSLRLQIGYSFDLGGLINNTSLAENIILPLLYHKICTVDEARARTQQMLKIFGLEEVADRRPSLVTGSARKSTCLARALIMNPQMLLLDDPTTGLSVGVTERLVGQIQKQMREGLEHVFICSDDQKILSEFNVHKIEIYNQQILDIESENDDQRSSEVA